jgi:hypothetical protein
LNFLIRDHGGIDLQGSGRELGEMVRPRERPPEPAWAPPSSARRFVINRFLNAADASAITPSGLRFLAVRLTLASVPLAPGAIRAFVNGARSTRPGGLSAEGT